MQVINEDQSSTNSMSSNIRNCISSIDKLGFPFKCLDPFLFCVYHNDVFPSSKEKLRKGNGADFDPNQPYRMV